MDPEQRRLLRAAMDLETVVGVDGRPYTLDRCQGHGRYNGWRKTAAPRASLAVMARRRITGEISGPRADRSDTTRPPITQGAPPPAGAQPERAGL
jgi:hypothetical protein